MAAVAPPGAVVVPAAVAAPPPAAGPAPNWTKLRRRWAQLLFVLGCEAAALATFSINSPRRLLVRSRLASIVPVFLFVFPVPSSIIEIDRVQL
jgi:hypothetical protein